MMSRSLFFLLFALIFSGCAYAQKGEEIPIIPPKQVTIDTLTYAHFEANQLYFASDSSKFAIFFEKMDSVILNKQGNVSILHLGASHVQGGTMSHRIRRNLLRSYPNHIASRGIIFPYSAARNCNNPGDYKVVRNTEFSLIRNVYKTIEKPLGMTGIAVYTQVPEAELTIKMNDSGLRFVTNRITLLGYPDNDTTEVQPTIVIRGKEYLPTEFSCVTRRYVYEVPAVTDSFKIKLNCYDSNTFVITGILLENDDPGITFHSIGVNGANTGSYLKCVDFDEDMELIRPDLVIFGIGINDAVPVNFDTTLFVKNYMKLVEKFRRLNPDCAFIFITNNDSFRKNGKKSEANPNAELVKRACYRLADATGGAVWDQYTIMGGLGSMEKWRANGYAQNDRVHFTWKGYTLIGDLFFNAFVDGWRHFEKK